MTDDGPVPFWEIYLSVMAAMASGDKDALKAAYELLADPARWDWDYPAAEGLHAGEVVEFSVAPIEEETP